MSNVINWCGRSLRCTCVSLKNLVCRLRSVVCCSIFRRGVVEGQIQDNYFQKPWLEFAVLMTLLLILTLLPVFNGFLFGFIESIRIVLLAVFCNTMWSHQTTDKQRKRRNRNVDGDSYFPPVTILKPLISNTSIEGLNHALESFFQLEYDAKFEIIFLTDKLDCDVIKVVKQLCSKYPKVTASIRLVGFDKPLEIVYDGMSPYLLKYGVGIADNSVYWISAPHAYAATLSLFEMMVKLQDKEIGMVHQLVCPSSSNKTLVSYLSYAASITSDAYVTGSLSAAEASCSASAASLIIKKEALRSIGDFEEKLGAGDMMGDKLAYLLIKSSWKVALSRHAVLLDISSVTVSQFFTQRFMAIKERLFRETGRMGVIGDFFFLSPGMPSLVVISISVEAPYVIFIMLCYHIGLWALTDMIMSYWMMRSVPPVEPTFITRANNTLENTRPLETITGNDQISLPLQAPRPLQQNVYSSSMPSLENLGRSPTHGGGVTIEMRSSYSSLSLVGLPVSLPMAVLQRSTSAPNSFETTESPGVFIGGSNSSGSGTNRSEFTPGSSTPPLMMRENNTTSFLGSNMIPNNIVTEEITLHEDTGSEWMYSGSTTSNPPGDWVQFTPPPPPSRNESQSPGLPILASAGPSPSSSIPNLQSIINQGVFTPSRIESPALPSIGMSLSGLPSRTPTPDMIANSLYPEPVKLIINPLHFTEIEVSDSASSSTSNSTHSSYSDLPSLNTSSTSNYSDLEANIQSSRSTEMELDDSSKLMPISRRDKKIRGWKGFFYSIFASGFDIELYAILGWFLWISVIPIIIFTSLLSCLVIPRLKPVAGPNSSSNSAADFANKRQFTLDEMIGAAIGLPRMSRFLLIILVSICIESTWYALHGGPSLQSNTFIILNQIQWNLDNAWHDIKLRFFYKPQDLNYWTNHDIYTLYLGKETYFDPQMPYPLAPPEFFNSSSPLLPSTRRDGSSTILPVQQIPTEEIPASKAWDWSFFEMAYVVTLSDYRTFDRERLLPTLLILDSIGLPKNSITVLRTPLDRESGARGCWNSHQSIARHAANAGYTNILVFEDDIDPSYAAITPESLSQVTHFLKTNDWDVFFFGHMPMKCDSINNEPPYSILGTQFVTVSSFLTHSYALHAPNIQALSNMDYQGVAVDNAFFMHLNIRYAAYPMWFYQRPVKSTLAKSASVNYLTTAGFLTGLEDQICAKKGSFLYYMIWYYMGDWTILYNVITVDVYSRVIWNDTAWLFWLPTAVLMLLCEFFCAAMVWSSMEKDSVIFGRIHRMHFIYFQILLLIALAFLIETGNLLIAIVLRIMNLIFYCIFRVATVSCIIPIRSRQIRSSEINSSETEVQDETRHRRTTEPNEDSASEGEAIAISSTEGGGALKRRRNMERSVSQDLSSYNP